MLCPINIGGFGPKATSRYWLPLLIMVASPLFALTQDVSGEHAW